MGCGGFAAWAVVVDGSALLWRWPGLGCGGPGGGLHFRRVVAACCWAASTPGCSCWRGRSAAPAVGPPGHQAGQHQHRQRWRPPRPRPTVAPGRPALSTALPAALPPQPSSMRHRPGWLAGPEGSRPGATGGSATARSWGRRLLAQPQIANHLYQEVRREGGPWNTLHLCRRFRFVTATPAQVSRLAMMLRQGGGTEPLLSSQPPTTHQLGGSAPSFLL